MMRKATWLMLMSVSMSGNATSILEFDKWMQRIERHALSVQKHLVRKDAAASTADAQQLADLYQQMQAYFEARSAADQAVSLSREGREAAAAIATHVARNDFDAAMTAAKQLTRECRSCHRAFKPLD